MFNVLYPFHVSISPVGPSHHPPQPWHLRPDYLLTNYPDLDLALPDTGGDDPLHLAAYNGHLGIVPWLRDAVKTYSKWDAIPQVVSHCHHSVED